MADEKNAKSRLTFQTDEHLQCTIKADKTDHFYAFFPPFQVSQKLDADDEVIPANITANYAEKTNNRKPGVVDAKCAALPWPTFFFLKKK